MIPTRYLTCFLSLGLSALGLVAEAASESPQPYGHPDYYPSPQQPAQLRAAGNSHFPGATTVGSFDTRTGKNIIWSARLPGWGFSSAIVVGDKVFVTCDWNKLVCLDARNGKQLWAKDNHTFDLDTGSGIAPEQLRKAFDDLTLPWLKAHAVMLEHDYLKFQMDVVKAAKEGTPLEPSPSYNHKKKRMVKNINWGSLPGDHLSDSQKKSLVEAAKNMDEATIQALKDRKAAVAKRIKEEELGPEVSGYVPHLCPYRRFTKTLTTYTKSEAYHNNFRILAKHGIAFEKWNGWMSRSFPTPISDGEHVWAQFGQHQLVCYDLNGNRQWIQTYLDENSPKNYNQNDSASPLLVGDTILVLRGGKEIKPDSHIYLRGIDKATGNVRWKQRIDYLMTSHSFPNQTLARIDGVDLVVTSAGSIHRVDDGSVIMTNLPCPIAPPLVVGNEIYLTCGQGQANGHGSRMKITLSSAGGKISGTINWAYIAKNASKWKQAASAYTPDLTIHDVERKPIQSNAGALFIDNKVMIASGLFDSATGKEVGKFKVDAKGKGKPPKSSGHLVWAGKHIYGNTDNWDVWVYDATDLDGVATKSYLGSEWHRQILSGELKLEQALKEVVEMPWLPASGGHMGGQTTPWPQGNRLYFRTKDSLYCIGDPKAPYHSPASAPAQAKTGS